jgi:predicted permease
VRSFLAAASRPLGFDPSNVVTLEISLNGSRNESPRWSVDYWSRLLERLRAQPGVLATAAGNWIPTGGSGTSFIELEGAPGMQADRGAGYRVVTDDYLAAMGIELLRGRTFASTDALGTERVGLVNKTFVDRYWPGQSALGRRVKATSMEAYYNGGVAPWITVVGVVGDVRHHGFEEDPMPELFVLYRQAPDWTREMTAVIRTAGVGGASPIALRNAARELDPTLAIEVGTLAERVRSLLAERRLLLGVLWTFGSVAGLLACIGVYALISFAAEERRRELAIRATLGASQRGIVELVLRDAARVIAAGLIGGLAAGYALTRLLESLLLDVSARDPLSYAVAAVLLALVGTAAALIPAWRASRADPLVALTS